jgi:hypothetical protein
LIHETRNFSEDEEEQGEELLVFERGPGSRKVCDERRAQDITPVAAKE